MDGWAVEHLHLDRYLDRLGVTARPPSRAALDELHEAHVRAFSFDNIEVLLGVHRGVGLDAVQEKFVGRGRGGYCFEHTTLFAAALERLGYRIERRLGRVGSVDAPRTHAVVVVDVDGGRVLADPGFGMSPLRPIPLEDGAQDEAGGWRHRLALVDGAWELSRWRDGGWELMHAHDDARVRPVDFVLGHHYTSTHPSSHFTRGLMVTRHLDGRHVSLTHGTVTVRRPGEPTEHHEIGPDEVRSWIHELAVPLSEAEEAALMERLAALHDPA